MEKTQFIDVIEEKLFTGKYFKKIYYFYALWAVLAPILTSFLFLVNIEVQFYMQHIFISMLFILTKTVEIALNIKELKNKKLNVVEILFIALCLWFIISSLITGAINTNFLFGVTLFILFSIFCSLDKKQFKLLVIAFIIEMVCETLLGFIDLHNKFIPGFGEECYSMSMHFMNPNWSGFVVIMAEMASLWFVLKSDKLWQKILFLAGYIIMAAGLFVGGSYAPEMSLFLCELALVIYLWVKNKKCPWWIFGAFLSTIFISFAVWWVPALCEVSTASANFFYESLGVIDNALNTNLVESVSSVLNKWFGWDKISVVAGADGWDRGDLNAEAWRAITTSFETFMFGNGAKYIYTVHVHNCYLVIWMEFGLPALLLFMAICSMLLVRFIRVKKTNFIVFLFSIFCMMLFECIFCCIEPTCYQFFVMLSVFLYKVLYSAELNKTKEKLENGEEEKHVLQNEGIVQTENLAGD